MDRKCKALETNAEGADGEHFRVTCCEPANDRRSKEGHQSAGSRRADQRYTGRELIAFSDPIKTFGPPVETGNGLETGTKAKKYTEGEQQNLSGNSNAGQYGIRDSTGNVV